MSQYENIPKWKKDALEREVKDRETRRQTHPLREFLFEMTDACNLACLHCGSACEGQGTYIDVDECKKVVDEIKGAYGTEGIRLSFTGGEPLLHPRFFELAEYIREQGFPVGMTTNGVLITPEVAQHMADIGIRYITLSLDGMEQSHDEFRQRKGCWKKTIDAIDNLNNAGVTPSITTVANTLNINELDEIYDLLQSKGVKLWRVLNIDPIGRAMEHPELLLDGLGYQQMIWFIEDKRINHSKEMPQLTSSCAHYLGPVHEGETRNWIFSCRAGTTVASVTAKGEFLGCLDVERIPKLIMGQLGKDSFVDIWENSYKPYRESRVPLCSMCMECEHKLYCDGDSMHTWNFDLDQPKLCIGAK